jgi:hypothetical protein
VDALRIEGVFVIVIVISLIPRDFLFPSVPTPPRPTMEITVVLVDILRSPKRDRNSRLMAFRYSELKMAKNNTIILKQIGWKRETHNTPEYVKCRCLSRSANVQQNSPKHIDGPDLDICQLGEHMVDDQSAHIVQHITPNDNHHDDNQRFEQL